MTVKEDYEPIISEDFYRGAMTRLYSYGLSHNLALLNVTLPRLDPSLKETASHTVVLAAFLTVLKEEGPLPWITQHTFMHHLHTAVNSYLKSHPGVCQQKVISCSNLAKLEAALRFLLVRSILYSDGKFRRRDIEAAINRYFRSESTNDLYAMMGIKDGETEQMQEVGDAVEKYREARKKGFLYFMERLGNYRNRPKSKIDENALKTFDEKSNDTSFSIKEILDQLLAYILKKEKIDLGSLFPREDDTLDDKSQPETREARVLRYFRELVDAGSTEQHLVALARKLHDLNIQSKFFLTLASE